CMFTDVRTQVCANKEHTLTLFQAHTQQCTLKHTRAPTHITNTHTHTHTHTHTGITHTHTGISHTHRHRTHTHTHNTHTHTRISHTHRHLTHSHALFLSLSLPPLSSRPLHRFK